MSTEKYDELFKKLDQSFKDIQAHTKECREALKKAQSMSDEALDTKITSLKATNEFINGQVKDLDGSETKVEGAWKSMVQFQYVNSSVSAQRSEERKQYDLRKTEFDAESKINEMLIDSLEKTLAQSREKSGESEAK